MNYVRQPPTEECPLTKEREKCTTGDWCGFRLIVCCFGCLTLIITIALVLQLVYDNNASQSRSNDHGAVATDDYRNCSQIGTKILRKGGNAVDAAVAASLCMAVIAPHKTGLGSGGYVMIYNHKIQAKPLVIDFITGTDTDLKFRIPSLLAGLHLAQKQYGKLTWREVVEPAAKIARNGFEVSHDLAYEITKNGESKIFGSEINAGQIFHLPHLAETLDEIARVGSKAFYNGSLSMKIFEDPYSLRQLSEYHPQVKSAMKSHLSHYVVYYPDDVNGVEKVINSLHELSIVKQNASNIDSQVLVTKTLAQASRESDEIERYTSISAVDSQDTYVTIVNGRNTPLPLAHMTDAGFFLDNTDKSSNLSSLTPIIFVDEAAICGLRGTFGADEPILTGQLLYNLLIRSMNVSSSIENPRYYRLYDGLAIENDNRHVVDPLYTAQLQTLNISISKLNANHIPKSSNAIIKRKNLISSHSDSRGGGLASRF